MDKDDDEDPFGLKVASQYEAKKSASTAEATASAQPDPTAAPTNHPTGVIDTYFSSNDSISTFGNSVLGQENLTSLARASNNKTPLSDTFVPISVSSPSDNQWDIPIHHYIYVNGAETTPKQHSKSN